MPCISGPGPALRTCILYWGLGSGTISGFLYVTLALWLVDAGVPMLTCATVNILSLPYSLKVFFAPLVRSSPLDKGWGTPGVWLLLAQGLLIGAFWMMGRLSPVHHMGLLTVMYGTVAVAGMIYDCVTEGARARLGALHHQVTLAQHSAAGYRMGAWIMGALPAVMALRWSVTWSHIWQSVSLFWGMGMVVTLGLIRTSMLDRMTAQESGDKVSSVAAGALARKTAWLGRLGRHYAHLAVQYSQYWAHLCQSWAFLRQNDNWPWVAGTVFCWRLSDVSLRALMPFFLQAQGWRADRIAALDKGLGLITTLVGIGLCGLCLRPLQKGAYSSTATFGGYLARGLLWWHRGQALTALYFVMVLAWGIWQDKCRESTGFVTAGVLIPGLMALHAASGFGTVASQAYLGSLCHDAPGGHTETPYAILAAWGAVSRVLVSTGILALAGWMTQLGQACVGHGGQSLWVWLVLCGGCVGCCLPGIVLAGKSQAFVWRTCGVRFYREK